MEERDGRVKSEGSFEREEEERQGWKREEL